MCVSLRPVSFRKNLRWMAYTAAKRLTNRTATHAKNHAAVLMNEHVPVGDEKLQFAHEPEAEASRRAMVRMRALAII